MYKVSVIIPVYQVECYLERAVDSVLSQTLEDMEIILVDDGSPDSSGQICDRYGAEFPDRIKVIHKENEGLGMARNTGIEASHGEYIAFLDSDDTVEPDMYETLYKKAVEGGFDIVMCDVRIIREGDGSVSESQAYPREQIDLIDYIANGNNITYSVNKLYKRDIWEKNRYEKMLFEDIALIPALLTQYPNIGYVPKAFYNYFRRANTISTTFTGDMADIVQAFRSFIDHSNLAYREEVIYNTARQLYWNMFQSRVLFQADFIELLKEYKSDFLLNPYIQKDEKMKKLLKSMEKETIPEHFICPHIGREIPAQCLENIERHFPNAVITDAPRDYFLKAQLPQNVQEALELGYDSYVEEYYALKILYEKGGIVVMPEMRVNLNLKKLRLNKIFWGFEDEEELATGCFGALKSHYVIRALLDSYETDQIYNKAYLPLGERLRDFLMVHFQLRVNGKNQLLKNEIQIYLPSILSYDMKNGENCCKKEPVPVPEGYEAVSSAVLKMWSDQLMENWNLYKQERDKKDGKHTAQGPSEKRPAAGSYPPGFDSLYSGEMEARIREVVDSYENSTCWKLTRPIRVIGKLLKREEHTV